MLDLMIDIETMGTDPDAAVLAIGAVKFDRTTGQIIDQFYAGIARDNAEMYGTITQSTMDWWAKQDPRAVVAAFGGKEMSAVAAEKFADFARGTKPWGNGSVFDVVICEHLFRAHGIKCPWQFWNSRDLRTLVELAEETGRFNKKSVPFEGTPHHALHDAVHETKIAIAAMDALKAVKSADPDNLIIATY